MSSRDSYNSYRPRTESSRPVQNAHLFRVEFFSFNIHDRHMRELYVSRPSWVRHTAKILTPHMMAYISQKVRRLGRLLPGHVAHMQGVHEPFEIMYETPAGFIQLGINSTPRSIGADPEDTIRVLLFEDEVWEEVR